MQKSHAFNLTGSDRKPLIDAIESFTRVKPVYQGAPKFGYVFYDVGVLDKDGTFRFDCDMQVIMDLVTWLEDCGFHVSATEEDVTPESDALTIEVPRDGFTPEKLDNLLKLVEAKSSLLKAALGTEDLSICATADKLQFLWFPYTKNAEEFNAYATLVGKICETVKTKQRVTAKERETDNPKYAMRCWLLSLGMIGAEYKTTRKILLKNLDGNSAFKAGKTKSTEVTVDEVSE